MFESNPDKIISRLLLAICTLRVIWYSHQPSNQHRFLCNSPEWLHVVRGGLYFSELSHTCIHLRRINQSSKTSCMSWMALRLDVSISILGHNLTAKQPHDKSSSIRYTHLPAPISTSKIACKQQPKCTDTSHNRCWETSYWLGNILVLLVSISVPHEVNQQGYGCTREWHHEPSRGANCMAEYASICQLQFCMTQVMCGLL